MQLHDYQIKYLENAPKNFIMAADVGLGKTIMALEHHRRWSVYRDGYGEYQRRIGDSVDMANVQIMPTLIKIIVIAPASKVRTGDWQREITNFFEPIALATAGRVPTYTVISYEMFTKKWKDLVDEHTTLIVDECHFVCNATTKRGRAVIGASRIAHQWIMLSATPLPNGWKSAEAYAVLTNLVNNKTEFVSRFVIIDRSRGFPIILGYRYKDLLTDWWAKLAKPLLRTGNLILPSQSIPVHAQMSVKLQNVYKKAVKQRIYGEELLDNPSKLFVTLRQIPNDARVDALQSIVESTNEHIVVFYNFNSERTAMLEMLAKSFKERTIYEQSGHASSLPARDRWSRLTSSVTLVQYQSGSQAIELTYASVTVYLSPCTSYANYEQSKGRTRRNGQEKTTLFYHIAAEGSLDQHIWKIIGTKRDFSIDLMNKIL